MWDLAQELLGRGPAVPYERCVKSSCGEPPAPSRPEEKRRRVAELLARAGHPSGTPGELLAAVEAWRAERLVPRRSIRQLSDAFIAWLEEGTRRHVVPHLPASLHGVPRANVQFLPLEDAVFSGSMNYVGRARDAAGAPRYEATYELNASLQISVPEFAQLVAHEVVPGHATTFALAQGLYVQGKLGFEGTVLTMNTRGATLFEGIANNAILMAFGVKEVAELPDEDLQLGTLLCLPAGRRQEPVLLAHLGRGAAAGRGGRHAAGRLPGLGGAGRQALRRLGTPPAARPHVPARLPRGHREGGRAAPRAPAGADHPGALRRERARGPGHHRPGAVRQVTPRRERGFRQCGTASSSPRRSRRAPRW